MLCAEKGLVAACMYDKILFDDIGIGTIIGITVLLAFFSS